jgi:hypothetical protein
MRSALVGTLSVPGATELALLYRRRSASRLAANDSVRADLAAAISSTFLALVVRADAYKGYWPVWYWPVSTLSGLV